MAIVSHPEVVQGGEEWHTLRCGRQTASEMKLIITPTFKAASNDKERTHLFELLGQRITKHVEASYVSDAMLRGKEEEIDARQTYAKKYAPVDDVGFITNDKWGFTIGYSPDGLVGADGQIECKSRSQKYQIETILSGQVPEEHVLQVQTGLLVTERKWCDYVSYCGGLPMITIRVLPDPVIQKAIIDAATAFEGRLMEKWGKYEELLKNSSNLVPTERKIEQEIIL